MDINPEICKQARYARDPRFDGQFFIAVKTTRIYCRPICPVKFPKEENVSYFLTAASASEAGYRPCLRCRPEAAPGTPAWRGTSTTVNRGLKLISEGVLDEKGVNGLSDRLGVTPRHLTRLFKHHLGASPKTVAQTRRLQFAKRLIDDTSLSMTDVALSSGYGSVRRFNDHFKMVYKRTPSSLRKQKKIQNTELKLKLSYRPPYDFNAMLDFLRVRATPGVEKIVDDVYTRSISMAGETGFLTVANREDERSLEVSIQMESSGQLFAIVEKVKQMFDLAADPVEIEQRLARDSVLKPLIERHPGQRLPGAWDGFEIAVRALVGQQISVAGATNAMGKLVTLYGTQVVLEGTGLKGTGLKDNLPGEMDFYLFPDALTLSSIEPESLPMPLVRARAIRELARQVSKGHISFDHAIDLEELMSRLQAIKGIGPWTAQYVAMRALNQPDAFLHADLVIKKVANSLYGIETEKQLLEHSDLWRPWRAYASMHLWRCSKQLGKAAISH